MDTGITSAMLPQLSLPSRALHQWVQEPGRKLVRAVSAFLVLVFLTSCSNAQPPRALLNEALTLQIQLTQSAIATSLDLPTTDPPTTTSPAKVSRIRIDHEETIRLGQAEGLRLSGQFDWQLAGDPIQVDSPFDVVLERGDRGQSWRLARPSGPGGDGLQTWITYPLGLEKA